MLPPRAHGRYDSGRWSRYSRLFAAAAASTPQYRYYDARAMRVA